MIHIKETEIIPFLKTAQTGYTKMISEGDLEKEVELAEKVEEALTQAMDIIYDYQSMADEHKRMVEKYETEAPVIKRGIGEYEESEKASCLKRRDYKDSTDLILWEYIIRRLTPLECCRLQGFPDNWAEELGITEPTQEDIDHWREVFRTQMEAMGESKKEKTDNQICKWLKDPESDSAKYKMWGNGIALPCAMFVMEGIAMILSREDTDELK